MAIDLSTVETMVVTLADGTALLYPPAAPVVAMLKGGLAALEAMGIVPTPTTALNIEQLRAQAAGVAARGASAVEESRHPKTPATPAGDAAAAPDGAALTSTVT